LSSAVIGCNQIRFTIIDNGAGDSNPAGGRCCGGCGWSGHFLPPWYSTARCGVLKMVDKLIKKV